MFFKTIKFQFLFLLLISVACKGQDDNREKMPISSKTKDITKVNIQNVLNESTGVVTLREGYKDSKIVLYNKDGSVWKSFIITDNYKGNGIEPFVLKSDDRLLVFEVFDMDNLFYMVKVDQNKNVFKFIKKSDKTFIYEPWDKHILKVFSVDFDYKINPLREEPFDSSKTKPFDKVQFYHPIKVKDEWLMIKDDDDNESWIKWKDSKGDLMISLYYSA